MTAPADYANRIIDTLVARGEAGSEELTRELVPGACFSLDPSGQPDKLRISVGPGQVLAAELVASRPGRWATLNVELGSGGFSDVKTIGFAMRLVASRSMQIRAVVRTFLDEGYVDTAFDEFAQIPSGVATRAGCLWIDSEPVLAKPAKWRTLILFFDPAGFRFNLVNLRLFS